MADYKIKDAKTADINEIFFDKNTNKLSYKNYLGIVTPIPNTEGIQSVVAGTNITVDDTDPANPIVSAAGGGGGVNAVVKPRLSGDRIIPIISSFSGSSTSNFTINTLLAFPFIPANSFTSSNIYTNVGTAVAGSFCRIGIYSDLEGYPDSLIFISSNIDCSTTGLKTAITPINTNVFEAGKTYWLAFHGGAVASGISQIPLASSTPIKAAGLGNQPTNYYYNTNAFSSPTPTTFPGPVAPANLANLPLIGITKS